MVSSRVWFAVAVMTAGCAGGDRKEAPNKTGEVSSVPTNPPSAAPGAETVRFEQGTNNALAGLEVGVMNVYPDDDGSLVVQIAINDRRPMDGAKELRTWLVELLDEQA